MNASRWMGRLGIVALGGALFVFAWTGRAGSPSEALRGGEIVADTPLPSPGAVAPPPSSSAADGAFAQIGIGLEYGRFPLGTRSSLGDSLVRIVRIDPRKATVTVGAASLGDGKARTASSWGLLGAQPEGGEVVRTPADRPPVAVINTSMFAQDLVTSVGFFRVEGRVQNDRWAGQQNSAVVVGPRGRGARVANLGCEDRDVIDSKWPTLVQSIRMIGCDGENVWADQPRAWSSALVGGDAQGRLLFIHVRSPYTMHALVDLLLALPLGLTGLHYGEGGPEASLYVRGTLDGAVFEERNVGSFETGFVGDDSNVDEWPLPNVFVATGG